MGRFYVGHWRERYFFQSRLCGPALACTYIPPNVFPCGVGPHRDPRAPTKVGVLRSCPLVSLGAPRPLGKRFHHRGSLARW